MTKKKFFDLAKDANEFPKVDLEKESETKPKGPLKEKIFVIDDGSLCYQTLIKEIGNEYDIARTRAEQDTDTIYDIISKNVLGNKQPIKYFLHFCQQDYEKDPTLYDQINKLRYEFEEKISIFRAYENHDRKTIEKKSQIKKPLEDTI